MALIRCPYCRSTQELPTSRSAATCASCGREFPLLAGTTDATQRIDSPRGAALPEPAPLPAAPATLGPYEIRGLIGAGGMGIVYQGWDVRLNRAVAVKTLKPELAKEPGFCERFLREARAVAALSHPNVTQIYDIGEAEGRPFFAMEYLEGRPLDALLKEEGKLAPARASDLIRQAAVGLKAAAARGIIHRDIKPSNLVVTREGVVKVTDFGLAKMVVADSGLTLTGEVLGSPNYLAPEQASGAPADLRSDIYSLGATLYELVTGRPPFDGPTPVSIILKHVREPLRSPRQFSPDLPVPLVTLTQRMLAKRPEDRPKDYDTLIRELDRLLAPIGLPTPPARPARPEAAMPPGAGSWSGVWILLPIVALGVIALWGFLRQSHGETRLAPDAPPLEASILKATSGAASPLPREEAETGGSGTKILSTSAEVYSPQGQSHPRAIEMAPRLERLREIARANLQFVENSHEITLDGRLKVKGSVYNAGMGPAADIKVRITLTDASGEVVATSEAPLSPPFLSSQQAGTYEALFPDPRRNINIKAELSWSS
ncbi:MAG TPA: serine/threonine-protein kinase [Candidatus Polarisedimenticolia bacterium]|nr:serine/threonine-protein kinase [Candidatus Polarisedimenticolia bacterium]